MDSLTLISHPLCPYVQRVAIILNEKNVSFSRINIDLANKPDWFLRISPIGKTPVLVVNNVPIFESAVICEFLEDTQSPKLHPINPLTRALHRGWMEFGSSLLNNIAAFYNAPDKASLKDATQIIHEKLQCIEETLDSSPYFSGKDFCIVDAVFGPVFRYFDLFDQIDDFGFFIGLDKVSLWRKTLSNHPSVQNAVDRNYSQQLRLFLLNKKSALSKLMNSE